VFKTWLGERDTSWRDGVEVAAMDGFTGFKTATSEGLPDVVAVMDPFHVVRLAGDALGPMPPGQHCSNLVLVWTPNESAASIYTRRFPIESVEHLVSV
jgi:hypothetical protein